MPGRQTQKAAKTVLVSALILLTVMGSIGTQLPGIVQAFASMLSPTITQGTQCQPNMTTSTEGAGCSSLGSGSNGPLGVSADALPNLSLPRTILSSVDPQIGAGEVIQSSSQNLTLYNLGVTMRLLGGSVPHDELLGGDHHVLSSWSFWSVEGSEGVGWVPLVPASSNFTVLGTNRTGTYVIRTMQVRAGAYGGVLTVVYKATSVGSLRWDLEFQPSTSGHFRLAYSWANLTDTAMSSRRQNGFRTTFGGATYALDWSDVQPTFRT